MSILSLFTNPQEKEVQAEIEMLAEVLWAAGISAPNDFDKSTEYRTFLISQLKNVPDMIRNLKKEGTIFRDIELKNVGERLRYIQEKNIELLDENKKLREENEFLRSTKEKIYILRE